MLFRLLFGFARQMAFTVHTPPNPALDRLDHAEQLVFVKDGFTPSAFLLGPFWLAAHGAWWAVLGYAGLAAMGFGTAYLLVLPASVAIATLLCVHILIGFEADEIHRIALDHRGWQTIGSVTGGSPLECERRFLETWLPAIPVRVGGVRPYPNLPVSTAVRLGPAGGPSSRGLTGWLTRR